jgi:hypothetical protein
VEKDAWSVFDRSGGKVMALAGSGAPLWLRNGKGLIQRTGQGIQRFALDGSGPVRITADPAARPVKVLGGGQALIALEQGALLCNDQGRVEAKLEFNGAVAIDASPNGERISCATREDAFFTIQTFRREGRGFVQDRVINDANHAEHFWSSTSRYLLFSFREGSVEMVDFDTGEQRWLAYSELAPNPLVPLAPQFEPDDAHVYMEGVDRHGFRQISVFEVATALEQDFSRGRIDHYAPVLSPGTRFLAYRQGDLTRVCEGGTERLYAFDRTERRSWRLGKRAMIAGGSLAGPAFSADDRTCFFVNDGRVYRFPLILE